MVLAENQVQRFNDLGLLHVRRSQRDKLTLFSGQVASPEKVPSLNSFWKIDAMLDQLLQLVLVVGDVAEESLALPAAKTKVGIKV